MGRLREINAKAQFAFAPTSTLIVCGTAAGSLSDDLSDESRIEIYDPNLGSTDPEAFTLKPENGVTVESRCVDISWGAVTTERPQGVIAAAMDDGNVDFWDPQAILSGSGEAAALIHRGTAHTGAVKCIDFNTVQTNLLASAGTKGEFFVWDATKPTAAPTAYKSTRLDEIVSLSWNKKVGHIIALGGRGGALSIWDLRKKSELLHIPTRYHISAISWHPSEPTLLMTASGDDHNPVLQLWDLRNANTPKCTLSGHERGVLSLSWCASDPELLLSSGSDNRTLIWNPIQATIVAELPASSQWVHKVSWCRKQPAMISNATLDGKITIYSIQDTTEPEAAPIIDGTPAGDDFFDSIPKNFQAQSTTFTLKQTPKWLKRPASAAFGYGGKLVYLTPGSFKVGIVQQSLAGQAIEAAKILKEDLSTKSTAELCHAAQENANENEKQDWDVIETLTAEHARDALLKYLGFTKADVETEIMRKLVKLGINTDSVGANQSTTTKSGADQTTKDIGAKDVAKLDEDRLETSVFGDDVGDDDFLGSINIEAQAPTDNKTNGLQSTPETPKSSQGPFTIFESAIAKPDELITRAILTGQFDIAIDVCLSEERLSDAFMLALCGGPESQKKVQEAYFTRTKVPYGRLLSSIVAGDLRDIVEHADLAHWKEILAILCNYAKPEDFSQLCEALGKRLESEGGDQQHATLCYLAGSKLEHLVRIWSSAQSAEEESLLSKETTMAPFEIHFTTLCKLMRKVSVFRKAVSFTDDQKMTGSAYELAALYAKYVEFAGILTSTGDASLALDYLGLVPNAYDAVDSMRKRLTGPVAPSQAAQKTTGMRPTGMRNVYTQPQPAQQIPASHAAVTPPSYGRSVTSPAISEVPTKPISRAMPAPNLYAAATNEPGQKPSAPYNPYAPQQGNVSTPVPAYQQQAYGQTHYGQQSPQQPNLNAFAPPPRMTSAGPTILPAAQRKDITPWNDAPDVPLPAPRRPTPSTSRSAIASPFPNQPSPTLQAFGPSQTAALAPPPKSRSPAPPRAQPGPVPSANGPVQTRVPSNPYAPMPQAVNVDVPAPSQAPTTPSASMYGAPPQPAAQSAAPAPSRYNPPTAAPTAQPFASAPPPPSTGKQNFAPPPKTAGGPPRLAATKPQSPIIQSPTVAGGIALSREPSRQSSPAPAKPTVPAAIHPAGDRTHIDAADMIIPDQMTALLKHLQAISPEKYRRPLEDTNRRLGLLFDQLNNAQLAPATLSQVHLLSSALHASDWARAYAIHMDLTANNMHEVRDWIVGIKTLIVIGKKSGEDGWQ